MLVQPSQAYEKPPLNEDELLNLLGERGLRIPDRGRAARYLRHIGYYRLSPYMRPLQDNGTDHGFRKGTQFDDVLRLYVFDRSLRLLVMDALERVEVAVRAAISNAMAIMAARRSTLSTTLAAWSLWPTPTPQRP